MVGILLRSTEVVQLDYGRTFFKGTVLMLKDVSLTDMQIADYLITFSSTSVLVLGTYCVGNPPL